MPEETKEEYCNKMQDRRLDDLENNYSEIKDCLHKLETNHLNHIEKSMAVTTTDVAWLKKFFWIIATASVGGLVTALINLLITFNK